MPWIALRILRASVSRQLLIHNHKMELTEFEIRVLLKHCWKQDYKAAVTARRICKVEQEGVISERVAQRWFERFNTGEDNTKEIPHSVGSKLWDIENISRVLEENAQKSTRRLSEDLGATEDTIYRQIKTLGKSYRNCRSVPHELTPQQAQHRVDICCQVTGNPMDNSLSGELSHVMKNASITATLTSRNSGSVHVDLPQSSLKKSVWTQSNVVHLLEFSSCDTLGVCSKRVCSRWESSFSTTGTSPLAAGQCEAQYCTNNHGKNSRTERNRTATTPSIQP